MPKPTNKLTAAALAAAKYEGRPRKLFDGGGLYLHIQASGRYWRLKYRAADGREKLLALGVYPQVSLAEARKARDEAKARLARGEDPQEVKRANQEAQADTFQALAEEWIELKRSELAEGTLRLTRRRLETWILPALGKRPIREIEPPEVLRSLRVPESKGKHETAHRLRQRIGQIFRYAIATGRADRDPTADLKGALASSPTKHRAAITTPGELTHLLHAIDHYDGQPATWAALRMLSLTFVRSGELRGATWDEFDLEGGTWRIPAGRMKMRRPHIVPLSEQARECLQWLHAMTGPSGLVFEGLRPGKPISENTLLAALRNLGYTSDMMTPHGFRSTASTLLHELGWPPEVIELQLAHAQRSQVAAAYNRSARLPERRKMMVAWADYLDELRENDQGNVVPLRRA
ncbi:integrase arm-type DNA-binding domain-containing protein [Thioalkalivibrio sp. ALgr3]|uniref:tyrosine-type recombinase/integrase n=1 Tax=Thioalkalivibrio sp. ALgr3 TaxID=1239292 RepID=UPI00036AF64C|nr:integrase arm-type DNA-binding domain-containing protein [Thioalkalivibrio sp. ALgr3]